MLQTSSRPRDVGGSFASRRGHGSQLSISDPSHHVTEAIGTLYGSDDEDAAPDHRLDHDHRSRPLSFIASPYGGEQLNKQQQNAEYGDDPRRPLFRSTSDKTGVTLATPSNPNGNNSGGGGGSGGGTIKKSHTLPARMSSQRSSSYENGPLSPIAPISPLSPTLSLRDVQAADANGSHFPLTNIDNPNDIAQELSNLQALRRMSMDVGNTSDPDLLPFQGMSLMAMPSIAPTGDDDETDVSRLLWVPANVHPELAPDQFKNFLENRVNSMKRRSGESMLSVDGLQRNDSGSLRRKKSMLSRQIDNAGGHGADGYVDGAERLERKESVNGHATPELSLNELVKDPTKAVQKLAHDAQTLESATPDDMPILPVAPGMGLRRSTRTTYRKGGSLRGDRVPFSKRVAQRQAEKDSDEAAPPPKVDAPPGHGLTRVQSEPVAENYSRPTRSVRRQQGFTRDAPSTTSPPTVAPEETAESLSASTSNMSQQQLPIRTSSAASTIPQIIETPPNDEQEAPPSRPFPQRSSSQKAAAQLLSQQQQQQQPQPQQAQQPFQPDQPPPRSSKRPSLGRPTQTSPPPSQPAPETSPTQASFLNDMANHPSPLPGSGSTRTDSLTFIPTFSGEERRGDRKSKGEESDSSKLSSGWKWFKSDDKDKKKKDKEKERDKEKEKEKEKEDPSKKAKGKVVDKSHENARLDVIQSSIDTVVAKGRESLLLDRESIDNKLHEERRKESSRKSSDSKKEKDGFFGSFFGGSKKKTDKESSNRKSQRALSPDPPARTLRPDVDFPYTRFPILEERAIYRMAHIKLANPKRNLLSQVLLSNFMYSYLAKIQAMHPQIQVPTSPAQKRQDEERKRKEQEQAYLEQQMQQQQQQQQQSQSNIDHYNFEYHRV